MANPDGMKISFGYTPKPIAPGTPIMNLANYPPLIDASPASSQTELRSARATRNSYYECFESASTLEEKRQAYDAFLMEYFSLRKKQSKQDHNLESYMRENIDAMLKAAMPVAGDCTPIPSSEFSTDDDEMDFSEVTLRKKKGRKKPPSPRRQQNTRKKAKHDINTQNRFAQLSAEESLDEDESQVSEMVKNALFDAEQNPSQADPNTSKRQPITSSQNKQDSAARPMPQGRSSIPPVILDDPSNPSELMRTLEGLCKRKIMAKYLPGNKLKLFPETSDEHRAITKHLDEVSIRHHTYALPDQKVMKIVLRGIPRGVNTEEIKADLKELNFHDAEVSPLRSRGPYPTSHLYLVTLPKTIANAKLYETEFLGYYKIDVEPLRRKNTPGQCYRCQGFFHSSKYCKRDPVCVKCAGPHESRNCPKSRDTPAKCANCEAAHTANFSGCPKNPKNIRKEIEKARETRTAWTDEKLLRQQAPPTKSNEFPLVPRPVLLNLKTRPQNAAIDVSSAAAANQKQASDDLKSIQDALKQMTITITTLAQSMNNFTTQILGMMTLLMNTLKPQASVASQN